MKVILQETMDGVGHLGDLLNVADGFARNYLLPRGKAVEADSRSIKAFEHVKRVAAEKAKKEKEQGGGSVLIGVGVVLLIERLATEKIWSLRCLAGNRFEQRQRLGERDGGQVAMTVGQDRRIHGQDPGSLRTSKKTGGDGDGWLPAGAHLELEALADRPPRGQSCR